MEQDHEKIMRPLFCSLDNTAIFGRLILPPREVDGGISAAAPAQDH